MRKVNFKKIQNVGPTFNYKIHRYKIILSSCNKRV